MLRAFYNKDKLRMTKNKQMMRYACFEDCMYKAYVSIYFLFVENVKSDFVWNHSRTIDIF